MTHAIYNEIEPYAADWLDNLITGGRIAPGRVERRSISEIQPSDVAGPGQRHFFAGIGWSYALRLAGIPDDADVWTGSCPCQPFSSAGKRGGTRDSRHLWPTWFEIIRECRPPTIFGEQVASRDGLAWLDLVRSDLERCGYSFGASDLCAAGVGAPHIRQRLYFVAHSGEQRREGKRLHVRQRKQRTRLSDVGGGSQARSDGAGWPSPVARDWKMGGLPSQLSTTVELVDPRGHGDREHFGELPSHEAQHEVGRTNGHHSSVDSSAVSDVAHSERERSGPRGLGRPHGRATLEPDRHGTVSNPWEPCDWIACTDGVSRPAEPGTFPLAHGVPARVGKLRAYGNSIVPQIAAIFIQAALT